MRTANGRDCRRSREWITRKRPTGFRRCKPTGGPNGAPATFEETLLPSIPAKVPLDTQPSDTLDIRATCQNS